MNNIGYINNTQLNDITSLTIDTMKAHGCSYIYIEQPKDKQRPEWNTFIDQLSSGDSAVIQSFDNAFRNFNDMVFFIKYCSKMNVRIISLSDKLDTQDELFSGAHTSATLDLICRVFGKRDKGALYDLEADVYSDNFQDRKLKRYGLVINMYKAGYSGKEIMERTGYRSKSTIYKILHDYEIRMTYPMMSRLDGATDVSI